jgi:hypothetical protein
MQGKRTVQRHPIGEARRRRPGLKPVACGTWDWPGRRFRQAGRIQRATWTTADAAVADQLGHRARNDFFKRKAVSALGHACALLAVGQGLDDLVGDVDARSGIDRFLEDDVELLRLGDALIALLARSSTAPVPRCGAG